MEGALNTSDFKDTSYLIVDMGIVVDIGDAFTELTGYSPVDILQKDISEVINRLLKINYTVSDLKNNTTDSLFLFTKTFEAMEVTVSCSHLEGPNLKLLIFTAKPNSRLEDKLIFVKEMFSDHRIRAAIYSVPDLILLKANQKYLDFIDSPYNSLETSLGKPIREIVSEFAESHCELLYNTILETQKTSFIKEFEYQKTSTYWDSTQIPIFEHKKMKYIFEIATEVTERVRNRQQREEQIKVLEYTNKELERQKAQFEAIIENLSDALLIFDREGNYTMLNKSARETYAPLCGHSKKLGDGRKKAEYYDANGDLIPPENVLGRRVSRGEKIIDFQMKMQSGDNYIYTEVNGTPIYDKQGNFFTGVLSCRDITEKVLMEKALKESEAKYKDLFNNMLFGQAHYKIITDAGGKPVNYTIVEVNPTYERIKNLNRSEIIGKKATELFSGLGNSAVERIRMLGEVALSGKPVSMEVYSNTTYRWYDAYYYSPKPGYVASVFSDITVRKNNEEELKKVRRMLLEAQEFAQLGCWEFNPITGEHIWSDELFCIYGYQPQEFTPTIDDFMKIIHPDDKDFLISVIDSPFESNECELDFRIIKQNAEIIWIHEKIKCEYDTSKRLVRRYGVVQDITQRKLNEIKLKESEERFKELAENLGEVIWVRQDGELIYISPAFEKVWGRTCQSSYDRPDSFIDSIHPEDKERIMQAYMLEYYTADVSLDEQFKIIRPDGSIRWIWARTFPIRDEKGKVIRSVGIGDDITKIKEFEESLRQAKEEAVAANKVKSQFLANMSHEIRTPLNAIVGFIELLSNMPLGKEQASYLAEVKVSTDALLLLVNDILDYSKIEAGMMLIETIPFNLHSLVEEAVSLFSAKAHGKGLEIFSHISGVPSEVQGDPGRLRQVLNNIIGNAVKFTDQGEVTVKVRMLKETKKKVLLQFEIRDTGIGISAETQRKLFQVFMQADASTTRKYEGTGLGLAISKKILELLGGDIEVVSDLGLGSTFNITLELEKQPKKDEDLKLRPNILNNLKVMIVDNQESNRMILSEYLGETGCRVIRAIDGPEGLKILNKLTSEELPQIILVDCQMPGMSGQDFRKQLLKDERFKNIKLISITSTAQKDNKRLAQTIGFTGYLSKPVRKRELIDVVSGVAVLEGPEKIEHLLTRHPIIDERCQVSYITILLVEDMLANQRLEMAMLKKLGYSVELAINGKLAVELCNSKKFHLILMDCQMPVMDGYEATDQIRKTSLLNKNTVVIAMTAYAMEGDREKCLAAGMNDYISKPITLAVLDDTLRRYL